MNSLLQTVIFLLIVIGFMALFYKKYLQIIIKDPAKKGKYYYGILRFLYITDLLPMRIQYKQGEELALRKRANQALIIFYSSMILVAILIALFL